MKNLLPNRIMITKTNGSNHLLKPYHMKKLLILLCVLFLAVSFDVQAQKKNNNPYKEAHFKGLKFRNIGPAFMSGRIADIAIHPDNENIWYVAVGSGGLWKTINAGTTWTPIFDNYKVYSMGCVTIDPNNPNIIWLGTGENVGGRHVGYGDGIYKSEDGGKSWKNMGLKDSQHISKIIVHPTNSNIIWVASQGPLWSKGGDRGVFKSVDGGKSWTKTLGDNEWTGVTDIVLDPRTPDRIYAATWQKHRNVAVLMGGGPKSGIHRSEDGGLTWTELKRGLPGGNKGKIGIAISPQKPDIIYAAIELNQAEGGVFKSTDRGASWKKQSNAVGGGTGPHYYQEIYTDPNHFDKLFLIGPRMQVSEDGGKNFYRMNSRSMHGDFHSVAFRKGDPNYLLLGTDGGVYETFDKTKSWKYVQNLPITQFYKVAVDDAEPFYNIYGGTQDNSTQGGPSRTDKRSGIANADWEIVLFADGHQPATEPGNPDIVYAEWQEGNLVRADRTTGEIVYIQPQPEEGENYERYNWDSPILVSPHNPTTIFFASQRVWKSENRGDSWTAISGDLTKNQERLELPVMDRTWSYNSPWDFNAMSVYNTITSLAQSPKDANTIYAGTDDGLIQVTEDGGQNWRKIDVKDLPDVPETAFVNDIKADLFDANTVYVALDNHKFGDFKPYLYVSKNKGKSWKSITNNIPENTLVWRIVQDHVKKELMFLATEFGIYFTVDAGNIWTKLSGGVPTISFRDLAIQRRENDLVGASFGRSFFVLDDYTALRHVNPDQLKQEATLFPTRKAWWYIPRSPEAGSLGSDHYNGPNPEFGATFTYFLSQSYKTKKQERMAKEAKLNKENKNVPFPGWDALEEERKQESPKIWLTIKDENGNVIRKLQGKARKGINRVAWDLTASSDMPINPNSRFSRFGGGGIMVAPGTYTVSISKQIDGIVTEIAAPQEFKVEQLRKGALAGASPEQVVAFWKTLSEAMSDSRKTGMKLGEAKTKISSMRKALAQTNIEFGEFDKQLHDLNQEVLDLEGELYGNRSRSKIGEKTNPTVGSRMRVAMTGTRSSTYGPTPTHERSLEIALKELKVIDAKVDAIIKDQIPALENALKDIGAPWILGQE